MRRALIVFCLAVFSTAAAHADPLQNVAKRLSKKMSGLKPRRIAVLTFPYHNGDISNGSSIVSERLTTLMVQRRGAEGGQRALPDKAMGQARLALSRAVDPATPQKLAKSLGVPALPPAPLISLAAHAPQV